jgi:hypothetical protein
VLDFAVKDLLVTVLPEQISAQCTGTTECKASEPPCVGTTECKASEPPCVGTTECKASEPPCVGTTECKASEPPCVGTTECKASDAALRFDVGERDFRTLSAELERLIGV